MNLSFYTIDDLRLGPNLWTENRFDTIQSALSHYRSLPDCTVKELGLTDGQNTLRLVRRVALFPDNEAHENVLVTDQLTKAPWKGSVLTTARRCVSALKIRYCLDRNRLVPKPAEFPEDLRQGGFGLPSIRRIYIVGAGWLSPAELDRRFPEESGGFSYPLVLKYLADIHLDDGPRTMELTHWDLRRLEACAGAFVTPTNK